MPRVSGAGNGYFSIDGANSYGYCAENKKNFWSNYGTKYGEITEWDDAVARKSYITLREDQGMPEII